MTTCSFWLLDKHRMCFQLGGTPELGCRDSLFTLKALLNARQSHDLKAYNMANHTLLLDILEHNRAPQKFVAAIQKIYTDNVCMLIIEKEVVEIPQAV